VVKKILKKNAPGLSGESQWEDLTGAITHGDWKGNQQPSSEVEVALDRFYNYECIDAGLIKKLHYFF
jgi:hypothetical protein